MLYFVNTIKPFELKRSESFLLTVRLGHIVLVNSYVVIINHELFNLPGQCLIFPWDTALSCNTYGNLGRVCLLL